MNDLQTIIEAMNLAGSEERSHYHLTYGGLIDALRAADPDAKFDERVQGIGSYRGYYIDIALFEGSRGFSTVDAEYRGDYTDYLKWHERHPEQGAGELPRKAGQLAELLESLIGRYFTGWKGGQYEITRETPLWLEHDAGDADEVAIIGIDENLNLITKDLEAS